MPPKLLLLPIAITLLIPLLQGCVGLGGRISSVTYPDGSVYKVRCQSDGKFEMHDAANNLHILVDNRGPAGQAWAATAAAIGKTSQAVSELSK